MAADHGEIVYRLEEFIRAVIRDMDPHAQPIDSIMLREERERLAALIGSPEEASDG